MKFGGRNGSLQSVDKNAQYQDRYASDKIKEGNGHVRVLFLLFLFVFILFSLEFKRTVKLTNKNDKQCTMGGDNSR